MIILRIKQFVLSTIRAKAPFLDMIRPEGLLNFEFVPIPFVEPLVMLPARVVTEAVEMIILRIRLLFQSPTKA
jgi:hypothetical protein